MQFVVCILAYIPRKYSKTLLIKLQLCYSIQDLAYNLRYAGDTIIITTTPNGMDLIRLINFSQKLVITGNNTKLRK